MTTVPALLAVLGWLSLVAGQSCNIPFKWVGDQCLYVDYETKVSWQEARAYCTSLQGDQGSSVHLASFPTCDSFDAFTRYLAFNDLGSSAVWVGARSLFTANMWVWESGQDLQTGVPYWSHDEDYDNGEDCAAADSRYYYRLTPNDCAATKGFVCAETSAVREVKEPEGPLSYGPEDEVCPHEGIWINGFCYIFKHEEKNWDEAERKCEEEHKANGGLLYYPSTCEEFTHVAHHLEASEEQRSYWVGAIDVSGQEEWTWVDGGLVPGGTPYWATGEPSHAHDNEPREHCAVMMKTKRYYLNDAHCDVKHSYICKLTVV